MSPVRRPAARHQELHHPDGHRADPPGRARLGHLLAPAQGPDHLPRHGGRRSGRQHHHRPAPVPRERGPGQGHHALHQLAGRDGDGGAGDLRHHAVRAPRRGDLLHGAGGLDGVVPARRRDQGEALLAAARERPHPPAAGRLLGAGDRHRHPRPRDPADARPAERAPGQAHRPADRADQAGHRARLLHERDGGQGVRHHRRRPHSEADRPSASRGSEVVKHLVLWKLKPEAHGQTRGRERPGHQGEAGGAAGPDPRACSGSRSGSTSAGPTAPCDLALYSEFESRAALDAYQAHPEHKAVMPFILEARSERRLVDYEI